VDLPLYLTVLPREHVNSFLSPVLMMLQTARFGRPCTVFKVAAASIVSMSANEIRATSRCILKSVRGIFWGGFLGVKDFIRGCGMEILRRGVP
jgi:hypothetical protein